MATLIIKLIILGKQAIMTEKFRKVSECRNVGDVIEVTACLKKQQL